VAILTYNGGTPTIGATGWTLATSIANGTSVSTAVYYIENASAQTSATFTATGASSAPALSVQLLELQGMVTSSSLDITATNKSSSAAHSLTVTPSSTTSSTQEVAVIAFASDNAAGAFNWANVPKGFAKLPEIANTTNSISGYNSSIFSGTQLTETMTLKGNHTANLVGAVVSFKAVVSAFYWRGGASDCASGSNWTSTTCWAASSGGASSGSTPGASDLAVFESAEVGNCTINSAINVGSITVQNGYSGTITHSNGNITLKGSFVFQDTVTGTFSSTSGGGTIRTNGSGTYAGDLVLPSGTFTLSGAQLGLRSLTVSGGTFSSGSGAVTTNQSGTVELSAGPVTFGSGGLSPTSTVTVSGATVSMGNANFTAGNNSAVEVSDGTMTFGTGNVAFNAGVTVSGTGALTLGTGTTQTATTVNVSSTASPALTFGSGSTFTSTDNFSQSAGTINANGATLNLGTNVANGSDAFTMNGGTFNTGASTVWFGGAAGGGGTTCNNGGPTTTIDDSGSGTSATFNGASGTERFCGALTITSGTLNTGTASMATNRNGSNGNSDEVVTISAAGTMTLGSGGFAFPSSTAMTIAGTLNGGSGTVTFTPAVTIAASTGTFSGGTSTTTFSSTLTVNGTCSAGKSLTVNGAVSIASSGTYSASSATTSLFSSTTSLSGIFNANSSQSVTLSGVVTMSSGSTFNGNTGKTTFTSAPTLNGGTLNVGDAGTAGFVKFSSGATFGASTTLAFPTSGGELQIGQGTTLSMGGTVTSSAGTTSSKPKIDCSGCSATQGVTISFASGSTLNINGLEFDNATTAGVTIASGVTYTTLKNLTFKNNQGNSTSGTHLTITLGTAVLDVPGCYFDTTATKNVSLHGTSGQNNGARALFEYRGASSTVTGPGAGESRDDDGDEGVSGDAVADDNVGGNTNSPYFGSVVEWVYAAPTDTTGTAVGFPTAAFDWNTFAYYGIYVAYKDTSGSSTSDVLWLRNSDGSAAYSFSVPQTSGDLIGTPYWDTVNETTAGIDANGNGNTTDTDVHVVYLATTSGHVIKLVDNGASLARPASGPWSSDFTDSNVSTITSPLTNDLTNLYFGGTSSGSAEVFGVQIASGANEAKLVKTVGAATTVTTTPALAIVSGTTYVYLGSNVISGASHVYRINMTSGAVDSDYSGATSNINGAVVVQGGRAYAVSDAGKVYALDALNFTSGGFTNVSGFPYTTAAASPIKFSPWVDYNDTTAYFGDNAGKLYYLTSGGTLTASYPVTVTSGTVTSTPLYRHGKGVIAVGASDGYAYFINRSTAAIFKRFFVSSTSNVSSVAYDANISAFMASSSDGKLVLINGSDVTDPDSTP
jgi:hypothetical protein